MMLRNVCLPILGLALLLSRFAAASEPIVVTDLLRIRSISSIDLQREGQRAVFAVRSIATIPPADPHKPDAQPTFRNQSHLYVLELADPAAKPRQITFGDRNDHSPRLSPDGRRIAFVRSASEPTPSDSRKVDSSSQIFTIRVDGGEAQQLTAFKHGAGRPVWSPDGRSILVNSALPIDEIDGIPPWPSERPRRQWNDVPHDALPRPDGSREQIRAWLEQNASNQNPVVMNRIDFQGEQELRSTLKFEHLFLVDADASASPFPQERAARITSGFFDHHDAAFSPDGRSIVYAAKKPSDQHPDRVLTSALWRVDIDGRSASNDRAVLNLEGWNLSSPKPSRDGQVVAFVGKRTDEPAHRQRQLGLASLRSQAAAQEPTWLTDEGSFQASVDSFEWHGSQPALLFTTAMQGGFPLMTITPGLVEPAAIIQQLEGKSISVRSFAAAAGVIVYSASSIENPCTLRVRDGFGDRLALDLNSWAADKTISMPVEGWITRPDGTRVQYWLMQPTNREPGKKYPLVVQMHGGPAAMWGPSEFTMWHEFQLFCSWGYGVVYCNPRGSGGYGYAFQRANFQNWGEGPAADVLAVVDHVLSNEWIDRERLVLTGGSYAGYLTAWIIAHDQRFKAAVAQRGVYDLATFFGEGNAWRLVPFSMGGSPYDARFKQIIERNSPMVYVSRIRTPLLIKHGSEDLRTGVSQSEMLYRALKDLNRPVEYVRYPGAGHDMSRTGEPLQRMDRLNRMIEFFERFIANERPAPIISSAEGAQ